VNERTTAQLRVIRAWLFGGWGLDARIGRITREHGDVEFWVERVDAGRSKAVLVDAGSTALATQPPEEACEFTWGGADFSTAYFDRQPGGSFIQLQGRWSDWVFPPGSFGDVPGMLDGVPVLTMSVAGMLAMTSRCSGGWPPRPACSPEHMAAGDGGRSPGQGARRFLEAPRMSGRELQCTLEVVVGQAAEPVALGVAGARDPQRSGD
jgi:hypothetical protein